MASCNPVFFDIAATLDPIDENILPEFTRAFGYGAPTGINALDEAPGVVPDPKWKEENIGDYWYTGDAVNMSIGQGFVSATPLQIANVYSTIRRRGAAEAAVDQEHLGTWRSRRTGASGRNDPPTADLTGHPGHHQAGADTLPGPRHLLRCSPDRLTPPAVRHRRTSVRREPRLLVAYAATTPASSSPPSRRANRAP
jgi:hypothetical protein